MARETGEPVHTEDDGGRSIGMISTTRNMDRKTALIKDSEEKKKLRNIPKTASLAKRRDDGSRRSRDLKPTRGRQFGLAQNGPERTRNRMYMHSLVTVNNLTALEPNMNPIAAVRTQRDGARLKEITIITMSTFISRYITTNVIDLRREIEKGILHTEPPRRITINTITPCLEPNMAPIAAKRAQEGDTHLRKIIMITMPTLIRRYVTINAIEMRKEIEKGILDTELPRRHRAGLTHHHHHDHAVHSVRDDNQHHHNARHKSSPRQLRPSHHEAELQSDGAHHIGHSYYGGRDSSPAIPHTPNLAVHGLEESR